MTDECISPPRQCMIEKWWLIIKATTVREKGKTYVPAHILISGTIIQASNIRKNL
jgi:hypothetical protein